MTGYLTLFADRADAGRRLAPKVAALDLISPVVYALPRGGVPVAVEVARALPAPLDLLLARKIGAPGAPELALGAVVDGDSPQLIVNENVRTLTGASAEYLESARQRELAEIHRRRTEWLGGRAPVSPRGRAAVVVDDGLATGATAKAALRALRAQGAARTVLATPVAPVETLVAMRAEADDVVCLAPVERFRGVGAFYDDFHQLTDEETLNCLRAASAAAPVITRHEALIPPVGLPADLALPQNAFGLVIFAHGSGSSRASPRNRAVAESLNRGGLATLLLDLLTPDEAADRRNVFDIPLLAERLLEAEAWARLRPELAALPLGLFGASTGAAAALQAAAHLGSGCSAVVSRGGRPDLAGREMLAKVIAPTLLIVGGEDHQVIELNQQCLHALGAPGQLEIVPGAGHLFEEPGALEAVMRLAADWFAARLRAAAGAKPALGQKPAPSKRGVVGKLESASERLPDVGDPAFAAAFDRYADRRIILLGEASHGTSEFYRARAAITERLITQHGFRVVAVEADWPDAAAIDRHVRLKPHRQIETAPFSRFPTWMWRNTDIDAFVRWLRARNAAVPGEVRTAFYGLDLYNMRAAMAAVLEYLDGVDPQAAAQARERYACLSPWAAEPAAYGMDALRRGIALCERGVAATLRDMVTRELEHAHHDEELLFDATENARVVADAERYYRAMYFGSHESWNLRDRHMFATLQRILEARGPASRAVVWAHNSHIGDARFTDMGAERGELNLGQLCREAYGDQAALIGFGGDSGTVFAADEWDEPGQVMNVLPSRADSYEGLCHQTEIDRFLVDLRHGHNEALRAELREPRLERFIGVIYRPATELLSHYARCSLPDQFDGFVWFDRTSAITPLATTGRAGEEETYPFGL